ncbi:unnamed protein product [Mytilus coruscus]|uniref:DUF6570 domain-containing protein n=1 Tax=Mytilus coruscus TaxID=42192 RepID=A0A6J8BQH2_MYTCO|nr:unnamed protein product [Mytilus coruscus]
MTSQQLDSNILKKAVKCLIEEARYQGSVIRDFDLPSNYLVQASKLPAKKKTCKTNTRSKRIKDKERKRTQRALLKPQHDDVEKPSDTHLQTTYKKNQRSRENKKAYSREKYSTDVTYKIAKKDLSKTKYQSNIQFREGRKDYIKNKYKTNIQFKKAQKDYIKNKYKSDIAFKRAHNDYIKNKYKSDIVFKQARTDYIKHKFKSSIQFRQTQKDYIKIKYKSNNQFRQAQKDYIKIKYKSNSQFRQAQKNYIKIKYKSNSQFQQTQKDYSKKKYRLNIKFKKAVKYASDKDFQRTVKTLNLLRYRHHVLLREKCKKRQRELYRRELWYREKKIFLVQQRRSKGVKNIASWFRQQVMDGPRYICAVCIKMKFRKQVVELDKQKYLKKGTKIAAVANQSITSQFEYSCTADCPIKCETINHKSWICYTCHRHLLLSKIPADANANGLQLSTIPEELKTLNILEKQLISLRIPFMKLVQLPKGNQRGIIGPCVSIPTDIQKTVNILPRCDDETQLVRCKLKRKQSYIGYSQYGFVSTKKISEALECLKENDPYYKDVSSNHAWHDGFPVDFADITAEDPEDHKDSPEILEEQETTTQQGDKDQREEEDQNVKDKELEQVMSKVSIALRKSTGKDTNGNTITASMLTDRNQLKSL